MVQTVLIDSMAVSMRVFFTVFFKIGVQWLAGAAHHLPIINNRNLYI
jgi:hypothetical protein